MLLGLRKDGYPPQAGLQNKGGSQAYSRALLGVVLGEALLVAPWTYSFNNSIVTSFILEGLPWLDNAGPV